MASLVIGLQLEHDRDLRLAPRERRLRERASRHLFTGPSARARGRWPAALLRALGGRGPGGRRGRDLSRGKEVKIVVGTTTYQPEPQND